MGLPDFTLADYDLLLEQLLAAGYRVCPVAALPRLHDAEHVAFLRHDVDLHILGIERIAEIESSRGLSATYYVPLTFHFNLSYPENRDILRRLVAGGHSVGLHYDLRTYPSDTQAAWVHLDTEVATLEALVGTRVESICMHNPSEGREDIFRVAERYVHPHNPLYADRLVYVSDSGRAWRDETLLRCFGDTPPQLLLLNTHPELWLGEPGTGRDEFLSGALLENMVRQHRAHLSDCVIPEWDRHPAPRLHDERERRRSPRVVSGRRW